MREEEKREMLEMASSPALREAFRRLRRAPRPREMDLDDLIDFLSAMGRFGPAARPRGASRTCARRLM